MEQKLEKSCKANELEVGQRYCMSDWMIVPKFVFTVTRIDDDAIRVKYLDDIHGLIPSQYDITVYEFPYSSLEKELL